MANELQYQAGVHSVTLHFGLANLVADATTAATLTGGQGADAFLVPTGHKFYPTYMYLESNADLTAGTVTGKVTDNGTAISGGPEPALSDTVQEVGAAVRPLASPGVAAGRAVGVKLVSAGTHAPATADFDVVLMGILVPA